LSSTTNNRIRGASSIDQKIQASHEPSQIAKQGPGGVKASAFCKLMGGKQTTDYVLQSKAGSRRRSRTGRMPAPGRPAGASGSAPLPDGRRIGNWAVSRGSPIAPSGPIADDPNEQNIGRNQANQDKHPVLAFETQKGEMLDEKLHRSRPLFGQDKRIGNRNILFLYFNLSPPRPANRSRGLAAVSGRGQSLPPKAMAPKTMAPKTMQIHDRERRAGPSDSSLSNSEGW
jgi:hypothetical protein